jgi:hypothetical protein
MLFQKFSNDFAKLGEYTDQISEIIFESIINQIIHYGHENIDGQYRIHLSQVVSNSLYRINSEVSMLEK